MEGLASTPSPTSSARATRRPCSRAAASKKTHEVIACLSGELRRICDAADEDIARNGLGCTKQLEERLEAALDKAGRGLVEALLCAEGARVPGDAARPGESFAGRRARTVEFLFGAVPLERNCYHDAQKQACRFPMDEALGLVRGVSPAVAARAFRRAALETFDDASETCGSLSATRMSADRLRAIAESMRGAAEDFLDHGTSPEAKRPACVVVEVDGKGAPLRRRELEAAGAKGKGEDGVAKTREVKVGAIFSFTPNPGEGCPPERDAGSTRYRLSTQTAGAFGEALWNDFQARFPGEPPLTLFLSDAAAGILNIRADWFPFAVGIIDCQHATEHLGPVLDACGLAGKSREREGEFKKWRAWLLDGKVEEIIREAERRQMDADACEKALRYFREGKLFMRYAEYRAKGWFIGSGVIEAACKNVVAERFCRSGMFWSAKGLDAMLPLRAIVKSGRHAAFWQHVLRGKRQVACQA